MWTGRLANFEIINLSKLVLTGEFLDDGHVLVVEGQGRGHVDGGVVGLVRGGATI